MTKLRVLNHGKIAGILTHQEVDGTYLFSYEKDYQGPPISLTMPLEKKSFYYQKLPPFFDGLLPEGIMLEALLRKYKIDKFDYMKQLKQVGQDVVGSVTIEALQ